MVGIWSKFGLWKIRKFQKVSCLYSIKLFDFFIEANSELLFSRFSQRIDELSRVREIVSVVEWIVCLIFQDEYSHSNHFLLPNTTAWKSGIKFCISFQENFRLANLNDFWNHSKCYCRKYDVKLVENVDMVRELPES